MTLSSTSCLIFVSNILGIRILALPWLVSLASKCNPLFWLLMVCLFTFEWWIIHLSFGDDFLINIRYQSILHFVGLKSNLEPINKLKPLYFLIPRIVDIRETAFVYAITAAGVTHAVTQACSMGDLLLCGCEATRNRAPPRPSSSSPAGDEVKWEWGGCGDDVEFGYEKSKQFMDAKRRRGKSDIRTLIDLHNNEAGRLVRNGFRIRTSVCLCQFWSHPEWVE